LESVLTRGGGDDAGHRRLAPGNRSREYVELFRSNDIEAELLPRLTADDLKDMGVASLGHRKKLLEAIAALGAAADGSPPPRVAVAPPSAAERRQLTVMTSGHSVGRTFCASPVGLSRSPREPETVVAVSLGSDHASPPSVSSFFACSRSCL
jgi:hypothetical protein